MGGLIRYCLGIRDVQIRSKKNYFNYLHVCDYVQQVMASSDSTPTSFVFLGSVDHGKSSLAGRILIHTGVVTDRDVLKAKEDAQANKMGGWWLAYLLDIDVSERTSGKTHSFTSITIPINDKSFTLVDVPGHQKLITEMIQGVSRADLAVLVCSARKGELEQGLRGQTYEHCLIAKGMGINKLIVVINKMDDISWDNAEYRRIMKVVMSKLKGLAFLTIEFVGVSALTGKGVDVLLGMIADTQVKKVRPGTVDIPLTSTFFLGRCVFMNLESSVVSKGYECVLHSGDILLNVVVERLSKDGKPVRFVTSSSEEGTYSVKFFTRTPTTIKAAFVLRTGDSTIGVGRIVVKDT